MSEICKLEAKKISLPTLYSMDSVDESDNIMTSSVPLAITSTSMLFHVLGNKM